jgi:chorismate--pyruvate lyase
MARADCYDPAPMLPRLPASPLLSSAAAATAVDRPGQRRAVSVSLRRWLSAPGSLTARLRLHGKVSVEVISQGRQTLWAQERAALRCQQGHVREVVLRINGRPAVWARSATTLSAVKGPWRAIKGLGTRPLAELLFEHNQVRRDPLRVKAFMQQSPERRHLARQWSKLVPAADDLAPTWSRRSVFWHRGHPLQVMESFSPWVTHLPAGPHRR